VNMTTCHIRYEKKIGLRTHPYDTPGYIDRVLTGGKKWEEWYITL